MEEVRPYWAWLQLALGAGSFKPKRILSYFPDIPAFYEAGMVQWRSIGMFTPKELQRLEQYTVQDGAALLEDGAQKGVRILTPAYVGYPKRLWQLENPPCLLYIKGRLPDVDAGPALAVVGTRNATETGRQIAYDLSMQLAQAGMVIISGGAKGIDTAAHLGALEGGGQSICVLGCGILYPYLMENEAIRNRIAQSGAVVSEFALETPAFRQNFPIRNRIISGLAVGVLVVEAAERSGSLITAATALEQNRDVFAVPCGIYNPVSEGVNNLLKAGAKPVTKAQDILEEYAAYGLRAPQTDSRPPQQERQLHQEPVLRKSAQKRTPRMVLPELSPEAAKVLEQLSTEPMLLEQLQAGTGLPVQTILIAVTELELCGVVQSYSGGRYSLT